MLGSSVLHYLVILSTLGITVSAKKTFQEILESPYIEDIFQSLQLKNLLSDFRVNEFSDSCGRELDYLSKSIDNQESWAMNMVDASSKVPSGIKQGNIIDLGMFDQCVNVKKDYDEIEIRGRHCMYSINLVGDDQLLPIRPTMSACLPNSCSSYDLSHLINTAINKSDELKNLSISIASSKCTKNDVEFWDNGVIIFMSVSTVYLCVLILCTIIDSVKGIEDCKSKPSGILNTLSQFSLIKSGKSILSLNSNEGELAAINGMRFVSTSAIVLLHSYLSQYLDVHVNFLDKIEMMFSWRTLVIVYFGCCVDTFFILSGFLMTYTFFKKVQRTNKFNVPMHFVHRLIRLTPPAAVCIFVTMLIVPKIASGPRWEWLSDAFFNGLQTKWIHSLLYVQNFVDRYDFRLLHFWSLDVDMQLFLISPIILIALWKRPKLGLAIIILLIAACQIVTASIVGINKYPIFYLTREWNFTLMQESYVTTYPVPYTRATPWLFGILMAYFVTKGVKPKKWVVPFGWLLFLVISIWSYVTAWAVLASPEHSPVRDIPSMLIMRVNWSLALCWVIYSSINDCSGPLRQVLSWKYFWPLSRISYSIYLIHALFIFYRLGTTRTVSYLNDNQIFPLLLSDLMQAIIAAFFYSILFEKPVLVLERMVFPAKDKSSSGKKTIDEKSRDLARYQ